MTNILCFQKLALPFLNLLRFYFMIIDVADRLKVVEEYYFSKKLKEIARLRLEGRDIINLGIGSPDLLPSKETTEKIRETVLEVDVNKYQSYVGVPALRNAMANWYKNIYGVSLNPNSEVMPLMGSKEGIMHLSLAFLNKGDTVLVPNPGYPTYASVSKIAEAKLQYYSLNAKDNWRPDFEVLKDMDLDKVKIMWVNYPNMPTGANANIALFEKLVAFAQEHKILLVNDNPYSLILNDNPLSILQVDGAKEVALEFNSLSKSHNMAGWRVGMAVGHANYLQSMLKIKSNMDSGMFKGIQMAAAQALQNPMSWHQEQNSIYAKRRVWCERIMRELNCVFDPNQTGMFLWAKIPNWAESSETFVEHILKNTDVFITPGFIFGSEGERYARISLCSDEAVLEEALQRVGLLFGIA